MDPRLMHYARSTRGFIAIAVVVGILVALLVIAQARLLSTAIVEVAQGGSPLSAIAPTLMTLLVVIVARAAVSWLGEAIAYRSAATAKSELREQVVDHVLRGGPLGPAGQDAGATAALVTRGVDALDSYYARYLPQLILAVIVPLAVLLTVVWQDVVSALIIALTLPLIPIFMALIGLYTRARVDRQWATLARLSGHFLDLVAGLPTLKIFGRAKVQAEAIRSMGERYRSTTMGVLRISFLSSLVLELLASLSVALVAVTVGVRLAEGGMTFSAALFILILVPEAYLPLRLVGQHFHAAAEGLGAADRMFAILESPTPTSGTRADIPSRPAIHIDGLSVTYPGRDSPALYPTTVFMPPGRLVAIIGPSGGGKSTLMSALLGFVTPTSGRVVISGDGVDIDLADVDVADWRARIGWVPQAPRLVSPGHGATTIAAAVCLGRPDASSLDVAAALDAAGVLAEIEELPDGIHTLIGEEGQGVSAGQYRRIALARALIRQPSVLLLDEPTAALDGVSEAAVVGSLMRARDAGVTVVVIAHRPAIVDVADVIVHIAAPAQRRIVGTTDSAIASAEAKAMDWTRTTLTGSDF